MFANTPALPADRMIPAWFPTPQFVVPYNQPTQWQPFIPVITAQCATIIGNHAMRNPVRCYSYNLFSSNGWQNDDFIALVVFAIDYLTMLSETNQVRNDPQTTITQVCDEVVQGASAMNLQSPNGVAQMLDPHALQESNVAIANFQRLRGMVQQWRQQKYPQQMQMPGMTPGMMPGMMPMQMQPMGGMMPGGMPGMIQSMPVSGIGGDPRFNNGGMPPQQTAMFGGGSVRFNMPGMPASREEQRELAKGIINQQREMLGGGGRWNKATDETVDRLQGAQGNPAANLGMGSAFDSRMRAQAEQVAPSRLDQLVKPPVTAASVAPTPLTEVSKDQSAMTTNTSIYPNGYFRDRAKDAPEDRIMAMTLYKRCIADGLLPEGALTPYDQPPPEYLGRGKPETTAPVAEVPTTASVKRESAEPAEDDPAAVTTENSPQATSGRWWDDPENQIPEAIPSEHPLSSEPTPVATDVEFVEVGGYSTHPEADVEGQSQLQSEDTDYTYVEENAFNPWVPHDGQWYRPLYQPSRQQRLLKVYKDGRPSDLEVLDRLPEDIPNMDYAQHILNTPSGRRERLDADADRALAAQEKIKAATDAYYQGVAEVVANPSVVLDNPITSFDLNLITEVEGAESTVWMIGNVKRAMREKESGQSIDICVSNALLYEAVYCRNETDIQFLKSLYKQRNFEELYNLLKVCLGTVDKGIWEMVNRRATIMLNQTLVLTMSLNEDVISPDFYANYPAIATGMAQTPETVRIAWQKVQVHQLGAFFHEASEEDLKRNTDSVCYFLPDEKEAYLEATRYLASVCTFTQLSIDAADLDIALEAHEVAQVTETTTPVLYKVAQAIFDATEPLGQKKAIHHLVRTEDGVVYQFTHGALVEGSLLISKRQHIWVDAR
jgi:hypothetical protein